MRTVLMLCAGFAATLLSANSAWADGAVDVKNSISNARAKLVVMVQAPDSSHYTEQVADVKEASTAADVSLNSAMSLGDGHLPKYEEVKASWEAFKNTRDSELIPALLAGDRSTATSLATGVQKERFETMMALLDEIAASAG